MNPIELKFLRVRTEKHPTTGTTLEYLHHHHAVAVLILDTNEEKTLLVNQYRPGNRGNLYEVPAGLIDEDENPEEAMFREVLEETGYSKEDLDLIYSYPKPLLISPGYTTENLNFFIVKLKSNEILPKEQALDEGEDLFTEWVKLGDVEKLQIDLKTVFLLNLYKLKKIEG
ncbi:MAG TPA: NUDIX hydrolase [Aliarcobacter cryaerophilus]|jgi:ADP-ribose pyrophosphatase|nr:NUDIX hydrolase [Aliarcobacter sp.]HRG61048.1 NUDIX hydrolase [Aliarcobacter cryaerophilus]